MADDLRLWQDNDCTKSAMMLLSRLVRCASVTPETDGILDILEQALIPLGFSVRRLTFSDPTSYPVQNIFATRRGTRPGPHLLFCGHTDVVPAGSLNDWTHPPFSATIADDALYGRGSVDMKSGIAAFIAALEPMVESGALDAGSVSLAITNDEEADAINGTEPLLAWAAAEGHRFDFAIVGEPGSQTRVGDTIRIGRRGSFSARVTVSGTQGHVAYPERAANPLPVVAAIALALEAPFDHGNPHFPPTNLEITTIDSNNNATNVIPARAALQFNVRFNTEWTEETLRAEIGKRIAATDLRGCSVAFDQIGRTAHCFLCPPEEASALIAAVTAFTGTAPALSTGGGTSDARFVAQYCPVAELGLVGRTMHQIDEHVPLSDLADLTGLYDCVIRAILTGVSQ